MRSIKEIKIVREKPRAEEYNEWRYMKEKESTAYQSSRRRNLWSRRQVIWNYWLENNKGKTKIKWWMNEKEWRRWRRLPWTVRHYEEKKSSFIRVTEGDETEKGVESLFKEITKKKKKERLRTFHFWGEIRHSSSRGS